MNPFPGFSRKPFQKRGTVASPCPAGPGRRKGRPGSGSGPGSGVGGGRLAPRGGPRFPRVTAAAAAPSRQRGQGTRRDGAQEAGGCAGANRDRAPTAHVQAASRTAGGAVESPRGHRACKRLSAGPGRFPARILSRPAPASRNPRPSTAHLPGLRRRDPQTRGSGPVPPDSRIASYFASGT